MKKLLIALLIGSLICLFFPMGWWILAFVWGFIIAVCGWIWAAIVALFTSIVAGGIWAAITIIAVIVFIVSIISICS